MKGYSITMTLVLVLIAGTVGAQQERETEVVDFERPEAWAMRYFTGLSLMQGNHVPLDLEVGELVAGFEVVEIPHLSEEQRTVGFYGTKEENLNKAPVLMRPLLHYGLSDRFSLSASYVPPLEVFSRLRSHMAGLSLNYEIFERGRWSARLRLIGQWSESKGDFTVAAEVAGDPDPARNPFGADEPSNDTFKSWTGTLEAGVAYRLPTERPVSLFANAAYTYADLVFQVDAHLEGGFHDTARLSSSGQIWSVGAGTWVDLSERFSASLAAVYVPLAVKRRPQLPRENDDLLHLRLTVNFRL